MPQPRHLSRSTGQSTKEPRHRAQSQEAAIRAARHRAAADLPGAGTLVGDGPARHRAHRLPDDVSGDDRNGDTDRPEVSMSLREWTNQLFYTGSS
ncbi:hypothetical protein [Antrihabitans spumae]|uniref:Uncharacterized protein n=1 Tax=Antrihabitans spumae TaxID=3373370 RepID=A0ABW7K1V9_9NOCA